MATTKRLYLVTVGTGEAKEEMLVRGVSVAGAMRTAVSTLGIEGALATKDDIERVLISGNKIIEAAAEPQGELPV